MSKAPVFERLIERVAEAYCGHDDLLAFAAFPENLTRQSVVQRYRPCADVFFQEKGFVPRVYGPLQQAITEAGKFVSWRETYKNTGMSQHFMDQFGCFTIVGEDGPFACPTFRLWVIYLPPKFLYPWHQHPGEEIYMVIAGQAIFRRLGQTDKTLSEGQTIFHESQEPHSMETQDQPVLCLAAWRSGFETPPVWTQFETVSQ